MGSVVTRTLPADHVTPVRAYAALRAQSPGRSSFMLESALPGERWGRYAILGYRARAETLLPSGFDPFATLADGLAQAAAADTSNAPDAQDTARDLAARVVRPGSASSPTMRCTCSWASNRGPTRPTSDGS